MIRKRIDYMFGVIWIIMLTLQIANRDKFGVMSCLVRDLRFLSALVSYEEVICTKCNCILPCQQITLRKCVAIKHILLAQFSPHLAASGIQYCTVLMMYPN